MFRSKSVALLLIAICFFAVSPAHAADTTATTTAKKSAGKKRRPPRRRIIVSLDYVSWFEQAKASLNGQSQDISGTFFGNAISVEGQWFLSVRSYYTVAASLLYGNANVGGTQTVVPYHAVDQHFFGLGVSPRWGYRWTSEIESSIGALFLYRSVDLPGGSTGASVDSGSSLNYGVTGDVKLYFVPAWMLRLEIGTLLAKATTYWSIGVGYRF